jgi:hypothetical protein
MGSAAGTPGAIRASSDAKAARLSLFSVIERTLLQERLTGASADRPAEGTERYEPE